jgi:hypothetical protein
MTHYTKVALIADVAREDASQVPYRAIVHLYDGSNPAGTMCGKHDAMHTEEVDQKRVVSCPECREALVKAQRASIGSQLALADSELVTIMYQRASIAYQRGEIKLFQAIGAAAYLLDTFKWKAQLPHDTSVPKAGDDALTPPNDGFNCALCEDTGKRFGKRCECIAGKTLALNSGRCTFKFDAIPNFYTEIDNGVLVSAAHAIASFPFERVTSLEREVRDGIVLSSKAKAATHSDARAHMEMSLVDLKEYRGVDAAKGVIKNVGGVEKMYTIPSDRIAAVQSKVDELMKDCPSYRGRKDETDEICRFCGALVENPCDEPPADTCDKALNHTIP